MRRKIVKQANQAYTITLPINWVRENNLDKKDSEVEINIQDKSLMISNTGNIALKKASLNIDSTDVRELWSKFNALYAKGVDEIEVTSKQEISSSILYAISLNMGYALVSQDRGKYIIKDLGGSNYSDLDEIFKRVFQMILMFYDSALEDINGKEKENKDCLKKRDEEINKFCLYLQRAINKMSYSDPVKGRILFTYSYALEKIGDSILRLWRTNIENNIKKTEKLKELLNLSRKSVDMLFDFYYMFNTNMAGEIHSLKEKARRIASSMERIDASTSRLVHYSLQIIEDVADLTHLNLMNGL